MSVGDIIDCENCGLRYMRHVVPSDQRRALQHLCSCGAVLGEWEGTFRLEFEPEEGGES